jgi:transcriptional regulator with XRE-family HTH domain
MRERLKLIRKKLGLNQTEFARLIGLKQTALSMIEAGTTALANKNIKLICATFNVNEQWLRIGEGEMLESSPYAGSDSRRRPAALPSSSPALFFA